MRMVYRLAPKYEELAALYFNNPEKSQKVVVAKVDATANDVPEEIAGFPTIKLFPAGGKDSPIEYTGSRTVEDLVSFIKENGKHQVDAAVGTDQDVEMPDADKMGKQAPAASQASQKAEEVKEGVKDKVKSKVSEAAEAVKSSVVDEDDLEHDEL